MAQEEEKKDDQKNEQTWKTLESELYALFYFVTRDVNILHIVIFVKINHINIWSNQFELRKPNGSTQHQLSILYKPIVSFV